MEPIFWAKLTRAQIADLRDQGAVAIVPVGAIEQHADHLPVDTDAFNATEVVSLASAELERAKVVVLPTQSYGFSVHHKHWPGTITMSAETLTAILLDIGHSLHRTGFAKILFVNGHGGNTGPLLSACNTLICDGVGAGFVNYFDPGKDGWQAAMTGRQTHLGHACEYETSMQLALRPELADAVLARTAGLPARLLPPFADAGYDARSLLNSGMNWAWIFNPGDAGYYGDPAASQRATGEVLLAATVTALAQFIDQYAESKLQVGPPPSSERPPL